MAKAKNPRFALVSSKTSDSEVARLRGLGLRLIDERFKDSVSADEIYVKPKRKTTKKAE